MMEYEEESITDSNNITAAEFSHVSISQRKNADVIFTSEKLHKLDNLVDAINNLTINNAGYELKKSTASDAQGNLMSNQDTVTHTSNGILDETLLRYRTIGEFPVHPLPANPIALTSQTLMTPVVKKTFIDSTSGNSWTDRMPQQVSRTGPHGTLVMLVGSVKLSPQL